MSESPAVTEVVLPKSVEADEVAQLRSEIATLKHEQATTLATAEANLCTERLKVAREQAHAKPEGKVGRGRADLEMNDAIACSTGRSSGNPGFSASQRCRIETLVWG